MLSSGTFATRPGRGQHDLQTIQHDIGAYIITIACSVGAYAQSSCEKENLGNFRASHRVEIIRHGDLAGEKTEPLLLARRWRIERHDLDQGPAGLNDNKRLAVGGLLHQPQPMRFGLVYIHYEHAGPDQIKLI